MDSIRVASMGNVDAGKTTLISCLSRGIMDDGNGSARHFIVTHKHEERQTSSVGLIPMGFTKEGKSIPVEDRRRVRKDIWQHISKNSTKKVTFIDLCGHERFLKTTCHGLTGYYPHYGMILLAGNKERSLAASTFGGASQHSKNMTRQHLAIIHSLKIPFFFVVTKVDIANPDILQKNIDSIKTTMNRVKINTVAVMEDDDHVKHALDNVNNPSYVPIFKVSTVTGQGMDLLKTFLYSLPNPRAKEEEEEVDNHDVPGTEKGCVGIDSVYTIPGVGIVVAGTIRGGTIVTGSDMLLGPRNISEDDGMDAFEPVHIRSIETHYTARDMVTQGEIAAFAIRIRKNKEFKVTRGMYLVHPRMKPRAVYRAKVFIRILHHQTTIRHGYSPHFHCGPASVSARFIHMEEADRDGNGSGKSVAVIRTGSNAIVTVQFLRGVYLFVGDQFLMREGDAKGCGWIQEVYDTVI